MTERRDFLKHSLAAAAGVFSQALLWDATKVLGGESAPEPRKMTPNEIKDWYRKYFDELGVREHVQAFSDQMATHSDTTIGQPIQNPYTDLKAAESFWQGCADKLNVLQARAEAMLLELGDFVLGCQDDSQGSPACWLMKTIPVVSIANSMAFYRLTNVVVESAPFWLDARVLPLSASLTLDKVVPEYHDKVLFSTLADHLRPFDPIEGGFYQLWAVLSVNSDEPCSLHRLSIEPMSRQALDDYFTRHPLKEHEPCDDESLLESQYGEPWPQQS